MLIISKFHDYYDTAIGYGGVDKSVVYNRKEEEIDTRNPDKFMWGRRPWRKSGEFDSKKYRHKWDTLAIAFCGQLYPLVRITREPTYWTGENITSYLYSRKAVEDYQTKYSKGPIKSKSHVYWRYSVKLSDKVLDKVFDLNTWSKFADINRERRCPIILIKDEELTLDPCLKDYGFQTLFNPFIAFQEIHMYLSGVLGIPEKEIVEVSNEIQRDKKGFDNWSFKRHPGGKKRKKKNA